MCYNDFQTYNIVKSLFVNHILNLVVLTTLEDTIVDWVFLHTHHVDSFPTLSNLFLPESNLLSFLVVVGEENLSTLCKRSVELRIVIIELTLHRIMRSHLSNRILHGANPTLAVTLSVTSIVKRKNFVLEQTIDSSSIELVLLFLVLISALLCESPSSTFTITFEPPTIEHGEVDNTVHQSLLTRCTTCLEWTSWSVHPNIHTSHKAASQLHVVVLKEDNLTEEFRTTADFINLLDKSLTCTIVWVSLTCKEELHRIVRVVHNLRQAIQIGEEQVSTLVSSETTSKTDDECIWINLLENRNNARRVTLVLQPILTESTLDIVNQFVLQHLASLPDFLIRNIVDSLPKLCIRLILIVLSIEVLVVESLPFRSSPSWEVNTVGHVAHIVEFLREITLPDTIEHILRNLSVEPAHTVHPRTCVASESGHAETFSVVVWIHTTHTHELIPCDAELSWILTHVLAKESLVEIVVACWHWSVNGVEGRSANHFESLIERKTTLHVIYKTLNIAQCSMSLVAVVDVLLDAQLLQSKHTTDTQQNLLLDTVFPVATIERVSDGTVVLAVHFVVSVKQIELHTTYIHTPNVSMNSIIIIRNVNNQWCAVFIQLALDWKLSKVLSLILSHLLTIHRQCLSEVTETIQETHCHHVNIRVGSLFHVVTCKDTKTT